MMPCDLHINTRYSDGSVELRRRGGPFRPGGFDVIAITDHVANGNNPFGNFANRFKLSVTGESFETDICRIAEEAARAWDR